MILINEEFLVFYGAIKELISDLLGHVSNLEDYRYLRPIKERYVGVVAELQVALLRDKDVLLQNPPILFMVAMILKDMKAIEVHIKNFSPKPETN